jgi:hypothetical protein
MSHQLPPENPLPRPIVEEDEAEFRADSNAIHAVTKVDNDGPVVTRRELWSYYRASGAYLPVQSRLADGAVTSVL